MITIVGVSGSLRKGSYNTALLRAAAGLMPEGAQLEVHTLHGIPLYDGDEEAARGVPAAAAALKERIAAGTGVLLATPEYNNSLPGVMKNGIDWLSRPSADIKRVFAGRPFAILGASPGGFGTVLAQAAWLPVLRTLGTRPWFGPKLLVANAGQAFDAEGRLVRQEVATALKGFLAGFVDFAQRSVSPS